MFEVELKFILTEVEKKCLIKDAIFIKEEDFEDIYYDNKSYSLSINDIWLRTRNGKFVLKLPKPTSHALLKEQRNSPKLELEDHNEIFKYFKIKQKSNLHEDLIAAGIIPLYKFRNIRKKYKKNQFTIDFDKAIFEDFIYEICEIEVVVNSENDIKNGIEDIINFVKKHNIKISYVEGKLIEYIRRKNPEHYELLCASKN